MKMDIIATLARRLRHHRARLQLAQAQVATKAKLNQSVVSRIEAQKQSGLDASVVLRLARALQVSIDDLLGHVVSDAPAAGAEEDDAGDADDDDHPAPEEIAPELRSALSGLSRPDEKEVARLVEEWRFDRAAKRAVALGFDAVRLDAFFFIHRGPAVPAFWVVPVLPCGEDRDERLEQAFVKAQLQVAAHGHGRWGQLARSRQGYLRPCFRTELIQPFLPGGARSGMIFPKGADRAMRASRIFTGGSRLVLEPRTLVTMYVAEREPVGVTQTVYSLAPRPGQMKTLRKLRVRLPAFLMSVDPHRMAPTVRWLQRGYRPRIAQVAALPIPANITTDTDEWLAVDHVAADLAARVRDGNVAPPEHVEGLARPMWWRDWIKRTALPAAVEAAVGLPEPNRMCRSSVIG